MDSSLGRSFPSRYRILGNTPRVVRKMTMDHFIPGILGLARVSDMKDLDLYDPNSYAYAQQMPCDFYA